MALKTCPFCGKQLDGRELYCPSCGSSLAPAAPPPPPVAKVSASGFRPGDVVDGKYEILSLLGSGGMGEVFKVRHVHLDAIRTLKVLRQKLSTDPTFRDRFLREARLATRFQHPNVAIVHDFTLGHAGAQYLVSEFVDGPTLRDVLSRKQKLPSTEAVSICKDVLAGLEAIHRAGLLHRDVAPSNIIITTDSEDGTSRAKIIDLGIAKELRENYDQHSTQVGLFVGNPRYASPEQFGSLAEGERIDGRSDLYSLGVVLYEMLAGRPPFLGNSAPEYVMHHLTSPVPPLENISSQLQTIVMRALQKDRQNRFANARAFLDALYSLTPEDLASGHPADAQTSPGMTLDSTQMVPIERYGERATPRSVFPSMTVEALREDIGELDAPIQIGRFTLHEEIARGKSGRLFKAFDPVRGRIVGVKVVSADRSIDRARMLRAARMWLDMDHDYIVKVYEVHPAANGNPPLIVTELVDGIRLDHYVAQASPTTGQRLTIVAQLCKALQYVHSHGIVHREVQPANVLIDSRTKKPRLLDSGIARPVVEDRSALTAIGSIVGDIEFMAPEQMAGEAEQRSDLFSLGLVLYSLLTNTKPKVSELPQLHTRVEGLTYLAPRVRQVLAKAVAPNPNDRFQTAEAFEAAVRDLMPLEITRISRSRMVVTLHGIRTHAKWQRAFVEVAQEAGLFCHLDRWNFGYFSVLQLLSPWSRDARVEWLRTVYQEEFPDVAYNASESELPSIVAHSFGTYLLGNALLRYPYLRFNKVIVCGSILPPEFPWSKLIARGQIQAVRNEFGAKDVWTRMVQFAVPDAGPSGIDGFHESGLRIEQEKFHFKHSEYFDRAHMKSRWLPFLLRPLSYIMPIEERVS